MLQCRDAEAPNKPLRLPLVKQGLGAGRNYGRTLFMRFLRGSFHRESISCIQFVPFGLLPRDGDGKTSHVGNKTGNKSLLGGRGENVEK